jgi:hypothetical protein
LESPSPNRPPPHMPPVQNSIWMELNATTATSLATLRTSVHNQFREGIDWPWQWKTSLPHCMTTSPHLQSLPRLPLWIPMSWNFPDLLMYSSFQSTYPLCSHIRLREGVERSVFTCIYIESFSTRRLFSVAAIAHRSTDTGWFYLPQWHKEEKGACETLNGL